MPPKRHQNTALQKEKSNVWWISTASVPHTPLSLGRKETSPHLIPPVFPCWPLFLTRPAAVCWHQEVHSAKTAPTVPRKSHYRSSAVGMSSILPWLDEPECHTRPAEQWHAEACSVVHQTGHHHCCAFQDMNLCQVHQSLARPTTADGLTVVISCPMSQCHSPDQ